MAPTARNGSSAFLRNVVSTRRVATIDGKNSPGDVTLGGKKMYRLMRHMNSEAPAVFADYISEFVVLAVSPSALAISITSHAHRADDKYTQNDGFRTYSIADTVNLPNVML